MVRRLLRLFDDSDKPPALVFRQRARFHNNNAVAHTALVRFVVRLKLNGTFNDFFVRNVLQYEKNKDLPLGFIGSISYQFQNILQEVALKHSFVIKQIYKEPMDGLITYYSK